MARKKRLAAGGSGSQARILVTLNYRSRAVAKGLLKQAILKLFVTLNGESYFGGYTCFEKFIMARAKLVPVHNRALKFKMPKTPRKQGKVPKYFTNQR